LSLLISRAWQLLQGLLKRRPARDSANGLFLLRILPFALSTIFTLLFTLPSFLLLEPRASGESVGTIPMALGFVCLLVVAAGILRAISAQRTTSRALIKWLDGSTVMEPESSVPVFRTGKDAPTLTVAGVCDPKVLVSEVALAALSPSELSTALKHELAHVRSHDNLKKLIFRLAAFPGMARLERAWSEEAELAADDAAVASFDDALDLAAALIKVSRLSASPSPALTTGLLHSSTALHLRVQRLFSWSENKTASRSTRSSWCVALSAVATLALLVTTYSSALSQLHAVTEWLVR
jgi:beta-lactamase regulating signal transducer with metallopeptidase domain